MTRRNSPNDIQDLDDLSSVGSFVVDKRLGQRASAKKNRRNRHYEKQFIRNTLAHLPAAVTAEANEAADDTTADTSNLAPAQASAEPFDSA
jgi:hypothetical protein